VRELGQLAGPACAAGILIFAGPQGVLVLNAVTFAFSALLLCRLRGHVRSPAAEDSGPGEDGSVLRLPGVAALMFTSGAVLLAAGTTNVAELVLARQELHAGGSGFGLLVSAYGIGMLTGSLLGNREDGLRTRYLAAIGALGLGLLGSAAAPALAFALASFAVAGAGNGLFVVTCRTLLQRAVPERAHGRAFGVLDAVDSWGFGIAMLLGGAMASGLGGRATFALAGAATLFILLAASFRKEVQHGSQVVVAPAVA
jgi:MFS family permease